MYAWLSTILTNIARWDFSTGKKKLHASLLKSKKHTKSQEKSHAFFLENKQKAPIKVETGWIQTGPPPTRVSALELEGSMWGQVR